MGNSPTKEFSPDAIKVLTKSVDNLPSAGSVSTITFAAGCFWGVELAFQRVPGVLQTDVGYTQGHTENPDYEAVCTGTTGHAEAVRVQYDASKIALEDLLTIFWAIHDPTTRNRQGGDVGTQYRSGVYYETDEQKDIIIKSRDFQQQFSEGLNPIVTEVLKATKWYPAEAYHQQYLEKGGQCARKGDLTAIRCYG